MASRSDAPNWDGILLVDKPQDFTSHDVIAKLRGILRQRRIGHAGTLDPMATGLLVVLLGSATRASDYASAARKCYRARLKLGVTTDTQDITGTVLERKPVSVTGQQLLDTLRDFTGEIDQLPPMYSAVQKDGVRLYDLARKGVEVERASRPVTIHRLELEQTLEEDQYDLLVDCSKGTYVRTLAHDIGQALGCGGCLTALRRVESGGLTVERALTLQQVEALRDSGELAQHILPTEQVFAALPVVTVTPEGDERCKNGAFLRDRHLSGGTIPPEGTLCRVRASDGRFLLLAKSAPLEKGGLALFCQTTFFQKDQL
jgi:tRNA pseudouridine55 synthase